MLISSFCCFCSRIICAAAHNSFHVKQQPYFVAGFSQSANITVVAFLTKIVRHFDLIIIDEPTEGLAPKIVELVAQYLKELKRRGISVLLIEQKLTIAMEISDQCMVMGHGSIVFTGTPAQLRNDSYIRKEWLEV